MNKLDFLRECDLVKRDFSPSDFKTLRHCFEAAKELYNALKFFDNRASRYLDENFSSWNQKSHSVKRSFSYPSEYYSFKDLNVLIEIRKNLRSDEFIVMSHGFCSRSMLPVRSSSLSDVLAETGSYFYCPTRSMTEAKEAFYSVVRDYLAYKSRELF